MVNAQVLGRCYCLLIGLLLANISWALEHSQLPSSENREHARLELVSDAGSKQQALLKQTQVELEITGMLVRTRVSQTFHNDSADWVEGIYTYPLPEQSAVDQLRMRIGERVIEGEIQERKQARKTYQQAKQQGQRTSLIEQQRPNIFTTSLANIGPGETVVIEIEYQQRADYDSGHFRLRFPMVILPRYIPGQPLVPAGQLEQTTPLRVQAGSFGWATPTDQVADADLITPPVAEPNESLRHRLQLSVHLNAGFALAQIDSPYHAIDIERGGVGEATIRLIDQQVRADRDFELVWRPQPSQAPQAALLTTAHDDSSYGLLMVVPPSVQSPDAVLPRAVTLVLDISGSMHGESIRQAKSSLLRAIDDLGAQDRFNLILFNNSSYALFKQPQPADAQHRDKARQLIRRVEANGGTEMASAIHYALSQPPQTGFVEQVLFITDGAVGNEATLFNLIEQNLGDRRLFTIGIGSAPNSHFMTKAAQLGRGTFSYIGASHEVEQKMATLLQKLRSPVMSNIQLESDQSMESYPARVPDLYRGEPLVISFRSTEPPKQLELHGEIAGQQWHQTLQLASESSNPAIPTLWGRAKIDTLMDQHRRAADSEEKQQLRQQLVDTALSHHLVSKFTSLVAVDKTPVKPSHIPLQRRIQKTELAKGASHKKIFGLAQTSTPAQRQIMVGISLLILALLLGFRRQISSTVTQRLSPWRGSAC